MAKVEWERRWYRCTAGCQAPPDSSARSLGRNSNSHLGCAFRTACLRCPSPTRDGRGRTSRCLLRRHVKEYAQLYEDVHKPTRATQAQSPAHVLCQKQYRRHDTHTQRRPKHSTDGTGAGEQRVKGKLAGGARVGLPLPIVVVKVPGGACLERS